MGLQDGRRAADGEGRARERVGGLVFAPDSGMVAYSCFS